MLNTKTIQSQFMNKFLGINMAYINIKTSTLLQDGKL